MRKLLAALGYILVIPTAYYAYNYYQKFSKQLQVNKNLNETIKSLEIEIKQLKNEINNYKSEIETLKGQINKLSNENYYLNLKLDSCEAEKEKYYRIVLANIASNELTKQRLEFINKSLEFNFTKYFRDELNKCINNSVFNYACFVSLLQKEGFSYKREKSDYLESVSEFVRNKGGDCDDWAFFAYSLMHFLKKRGIKGIKLYTKQKGSKFYLYEENNTIYYIPNAKELLVNLNEYPYVIAFCYQINATLGHCINAFCKESISPLDKDKFADCLAFEPQNGEYKGKLSNYKLITLLSGDFFFKEWELWK